MNIIKNNLEKKEIIITKKSEHKILFVFKKNSVFFELTKNNINVEELVENLNIEFEKLNKKLSELEITRKQEIDEQKKYNEMLIEENKKLKEEIKYMKKIEDITKNYKNEVNDLAYELIEQFKMQIQKENTQNEKLFNLTKDIQEIKNFLEESNNEELNSIWFKNNNNKLENDSNKIKREMKYKDTNNVIYEREEKNKKDKFQKYDDEPIIMKINKTARKLGQNNLNFIAEEFKFKKKLFHIEIKNNNNSKKGKNNASNEKGFIKTENNIQKISKNNQVERNRNYITNTNKLSRKNSKIFETQTHLNKKNLSSYSANKIKYILLKNYIYF